MMNYKYISVSVSLNASDRNYNRNRQIKETSDFAEVSDNSTLFQPTIHPHIYIELVN